MSTETADCVRIAVVGSGLAAVACVRALCEQVKAARAETSAGGVKEIKVYLFTARGKFTSQMHGAPNQAFCKPGQPFYDYGCQYVSTYDRTPFCKFIEKHWRGDKKTNCVKELVPVASGQTSNRECFPVRKAKAVVTTGNNMSSPRFDFSDLCAERSASVSGKETPGARTRVFYSETGMWNLMLEQFAALEKDFPNFLTVVRGFPTEDRMVKGLVQHRTATTTSDRKMSSCKWSLKLGKRRPQPDFVDSENKVVLFDFVVGAFSQHVLFEPFLKTAEVVTQDKSGSTSAGEQGRNPCQNLLDTLSKSRCNQLFPMQVKVTLNVPVPPWLGLHVIVQNSCKIGEDESPAAERAKGLFPIAFVGNNSFKQAQQQAGPQATATTASSPFKPKSRWNNSKRHRSSSHEDEGKNIDDGTKEENDSNIAYLTVLSTAAYAEYEFNLGSRQQYRKTGEKTLIKALEQLLRDDHDNRAKARNLPPRDPPLASSIASYEVNRILHWEDAVPVNRVESSPENCCILDAANHIGWCGDICVAPCAEAAWCSGIMMASRVIGSGIFENPSCKDFAQSMQTELRPTLERLSRQGGSTADGGSYSSTDIGVFAFPTNELGDCSTHFYDYLQEKDLTSGRNKGGYQRWFDPEDGGAGKKGSGKNAQSKSNRAGEGSSSSGRNHGKSKGKKASGNEARGSKQGQQIGK
ncbi:unnamed protein product [Amoebophrya sp. A120]|nr:unnamed protein product [Amoebophrya sp. A120]|eukprot:GSA120T00005662001.1